MNAKSTTRSLDILAAETDSELDLDFADAGIHAGFPSPAQDYMETGLDLNKALVRHKASTFYGRVVGDSMRDAGIDEGDIIVIDKSIEARSGDLVVCYIEGEFAIKFLKMEAGKLLLYPANENYAPIEVTNADSFRVWGVVTYTIKKRNSRI